MEKVCILLSTYNGEKYVNEQIDSLLAQENVDVTLLVRDDGSKDNTLKILQENNLNHINLIHLLCISVVILRLSVHYKRVRGI